MEIKIPTTGKPCTKCAKYDGNPLHAGICNVCYSNAFFGEIKINPDVSGKSNETIINSNNLEKSKIIFGLLFLIFLLWIMFGGLFENKDTYKNTVNIDCRQSEWSGSPYCNGEYDKENYQENNYYQNMAR